MDIKWKNNHKKRKLTIIVLIILTIGTMAFFPGIIRRGEAIYASYEKQQEEELNSTDQIFIENIYIGCYILYKEARERESGNQISTSEYFVEFDRKASDEYTHEELQEMQEYLNQIFDQWTALFEDYREEVDYCVVGNNGDSNTSRDLEIAVSGFSSNSEIATYYRNIFKVYFDAHGAVQVTVYWAQNINEEDTIIKELGKTARNGLSGLESLQNFGYSELIKIKKPQDFTVIFAIPRKNTLNGEFMDSSAYWHKISAYSQAGGGLLFWAALILLTLFAFYMGSRKVWGNEVMVDRPGNWYLMEAAVIGIICVIGNITDNLVEMIYFRNYYGSFSNLFSALMSRGIYGAVLPILQTACTLLAVYAVWYASVCFVRPVFSLGVKEYIRQYSLFYQIFPWIKKKWSTFISEVHHIDFEQKYTNTILKVVIINFVLLLVISMMWYWGVLGLIVYSLVLFYILKRNYDKVRKDYRTLLKGVNRIAEGDLNTVITEDLGMFEPFRNELAKIRTGFKKAVEDEVKSQRMKTDLITNVSHDLKTPLTAITTYIALLKKEDATEEERRSYIETLEKKSLRLKLLIEDLFEISKLSSNNIVLNLMELDVVNLMKQVSIEYAEKLQEQGIELRWHVPDEKVIVRLDNQKTYRIFENLFVNVDKYAMHYSRVYIDVRMQGDRAEIIMKNISAAELNINAEEITERFVRGDSSRNTEGSGLGLAIAKSLTEAQGGRFRVEIDGDLFKVVVEFPVVA